MSFYKNFARLAMAFSLLFFSTSHAAPPKSPTKKEITFSKKLPLRNKKKGPNPSPVPPVKAVEVAPVPMNSFEQALVLLEERGAHLLVETGGKPEWLNATNIFENWADAHDAALLSFNDRTLEAASQERFFTRFLAFLRERGESLLVETGRDSTAYNTSAAPQESLPSAEEATTATDSDIVVVLDFLYLGSDDYYENNPLPFQKHYLQELVEVYYPGFSPKAVVMIDGCNLPGGGPGKLVIEYLVEKGWQIFAKGPQTILVRA